MKLHVQKMGVGSDLVILHGLFGSGDNWLTIAKQLADRFTVHLIDQRNHGQSKHCKEMTYPLMAADLKDYLDSENISMVHLIGHSMGGKTAMQFAADYKNYLDKLIIVDIAPKKYPDHHSELIDAMLGLDLVAAESRSQLVNDLKEKVPNLAVRQFLLKNVVRYSNGNYMWQMNIEGIKQNYSAIMKAPEIKEIITTQTLFINGTHSTYIQQKDQIDIKTSFNAVEFESIDAGHWLHAEKPDVFIKIITSYLT